MEKYELLSDVVIRTPRMPFEEIYSYFDLKEKLFLQSKEIQNAIRIASIDLYDECLKFEDLDQKEKKRVLYSLCRYITRMSSRCTPFGLFAGCALAKFAKHTNLIVSEDIVRHTKLDMSYLYNLTQYLSQLPELKYKLKYYPNSSIYKLGNEYRYIWYYFLKDKRQYRICSVEPTSYLRSILTRSKCGAYVEDLLPFVSNDYISKTDSISYINELIDSQILVSELEPNISGEDLLSRIIHILSEITPQHEYLKILVDIRNIMSEIDSSRCNSINGYNRIESLVERIGAPYNRKYLFQVDVNNIYIDNQISYKVQDELIRTAHFLNKVIPYKDNKNLLLFKEEFIKRFGDGSIELSIVLDPEIGIGYPVSTYSEDTSSLLDGFFMENEDTSISSLELNEFSLKVLRKILDGNIAAKEIFLHDEDFDTKEENWNNLPITFSAFFKILKSTETETLILLNAIGNTSAANLLARFAYTDKNVEELVFNIANIEREAFPDAISAEIIHIPDSRAGNVLFRPNLREYEIAFLANSTLSKNNVIPVSDILICIKNDRIVLKSKSLNKEILPYSTNAFNHNSSSNPIYRFLCDMQQQKKRASFSFDLSPLFGVVSYIPRIRYKNTILSLAVWKIEVSDIIHLLGIENDKELLLLVRQWREKMKIPDTSLLIDGDNELFVDWNDCISIRSFFSIIRKHTSFVLREFPFRQDSFVVKGMNGAGYLNECIASFVKK